MLIWTARFSRRRAVILVVFLGVILALVVMLAGRHNQTEQTAKLSTNENRVEFLQSYGWEVNSEPMETLQFLLPKELPEPYVTYNELQKQQGFDLTACCGKQVERYTYAVTNYPDRPDGIQVNLYVCNGAAVAGDVCCPGADGFQQGLAFPSKKG